MVGIESNDDLGTHIRFRIVIVTAIWKRHDVFRMFAEGVKLLQKQFDIDIICCVAGSEGRITRDLVTSYGFEYVEAENSPLHIKLQKCVNIARKLNPNYCLMVGSDDVIAPNLMQKYISLARQNYDYISLLDCYFFDTVSKRGLYWAGYNTTRNRGMALGMGRLISSNLLDKICWRVWPPGYDKILDTGFDKQLEKVEYTKYEINLKKENLFALDIKSQQNMTPFAKWDNSFFVDGKKLLFDNLPKELAEQIYGQRG